MRNFQDIVKFLKLEHFLCSDINISFWIFFSVHFLTQVGKYIIAVYNRYLFKLYAYELVTLFFMDTHFYKLNTWSQKKILTVFQKSLAKSYLNIISNKIIITINKYWKISNISVVKRNKCRFLIKVFKSYVKDLKYFVYRYYVV